MENQANNSSLKNFIIKVIVVDIGLIILAGFISISYKLDFGIILLLLGILVEGVGNLLAGPSLANRQNDRDIASSNRPNEALSNRISNYLTNSIPHDGFENVMLYSGLMTIAISIPFLVAWIF
jgi:hypothetical protein